MSNWFFSHQKRSYQCSAAIFSSVFAAYTIIGRIGFVYNVIDAIFGEWSDLAEYYRFSWQTMWTTLVVNITLCSKLCESKRYGMFTTVFECHVILVVYLHSTCAFHSIQSKCAGHSWYLSADTQLFIVSPFIVYLLYRFKNKTLVALVLLIIGNIGCTIVIYQKYKFTGL